MPDITTNPSSLHEPDVVPTAAILGGVAGLFAMVALVALVVLWLLPGTHPALPDLGVVPQTPARLDWGDAGREQLQRLREREDVNLGTYQWLDERHTRARIPIERAMQVLLEQSQGSGHVPPTGDEGRSPP